MHNYKYERVPDENSAESIDSATFAWHKFLGVVFCLIFLCIFVLLSAHKPTARQLVTLTSEIGEINIVSTITPKVVELRPQSQPPAQSQSDFNNTRSKYFVYTPSCRMPYVSPFAAEVLKIFKPLQAAKCAKDEALVGAIYDSKIRQYMLHINLKASRKYGNASNAVACCYCEIVRWGSGKNADGKYKLLPCSNFHNDFVVPVHIDAILVNCSSSTTKKSLQKSVLSFIQNKNDTINATLNAKVSSGGNRKPGVLLIGIDSMSRMNFRRNMPKTLNYLEQKHWFELQGYNKVGDNTFPNLMALFTGLNNTNAFKECNPKSVGGLEHCPFIWKSFKNYSYRTAYAEDCSFLSTFNYLKVGFQKPPTDYYLRPMLLAAEATLKVTSKAGLPFCLGSKQYGEYIYDYALEYARRYRDEPIFGLFWTNTFSHNQFHISSSMDQKMLEYFKSFEKDNILENSIVMFFSDHGMRFGPLLKLPNSYLEERLPMFFMSLPKWFQTQNPDFVKALEVNRNRLTSPYDIHMTFNHILELYEPNAKLPPARDCATCQSIFREIPLNRSCSDAGISEHWCSCEPYERVAANGGTVKIVTNLVIDEINAYLDAQGFPLLCKKHKLMKIERAELKVEDHFGEPRNSTYRITFVTTPGGAYFQATAEFNSSAKSVAVDIEDISRLNTYNKTAACIQEKKVQKYCIC